MKRMKVKQLMVPLDEYVTLSEDAGLYDAVMALERTKIKSHPTLEGHSVVIVLDKKERVIGKLSRLDVLRCLEPKYAELGDLKKISGYGLSSEFLRSMMDRYDLWKTSLDHISRKAARIKVGEITNSPLPEESIDIESSLNQAIHQFVIGHHQSLLVTSGGNVVGILFLTDVFEIVGERIKKCKT